MIFDRLENARLYDDLHPRLRAALTYLSQTDLAALPLGKHAIDGERLFAIAAEYAPKSEADSKYEAHRVYWDVQYLVRGAERIGVTQTVTLQVSEPYDAARDILFFARGPGDFITLQAGMFAVFGPQDAHMPGVVTPGCDFVRKVVVKVQWTDE